MKILLNSIEWDLVLTWCNSLIPSGLTKCARLHFVFLPKDCLYVPICFFWELCDFPQAKICWSGTSHSKGKGAQVWEYSNIKLSPGVCLFTLRGTWNHISIFLPGCVLCELAPGPVNVALQHSHDQISLGGVKPAWQASLASWPFVWRECLPEKVQARPGLRRLQRGSVHCQRSMGYRPKRLGSL